MNKTPHPQSHILKAIAEDKDARIQTKSNSHPHWWYNVSLEKILRNPHLEYRIVPKPDPDGWIEWHGGENPVPGKRVECKYRSGMKVPGTSDEFRWEHELLGGDIIAYRVVKDPANPRVFYMWLYVHLHTTQTLNGGFYLEGETPNHIPNYKPVRLDWSRTEMPE